jgi:hypothetical protein
MCQQDATELASNGREKLDLDRSGLLPWSTRTELLDAAESGQVPLGVAGSADVGMRTERCLRLARRHDRSLHLGDACGEFFFNRVLDQRLSNRQLHFLGHGLSAG